eukprot:6316067-Alexandrium_andersonii.AAC.1
METPPRAGSRSESAPESPLLHPLFGSVYRRGMGDAALPWAALGMKKARASNVGCQPCGPLD